MAIGDGNYSGGNNGSYNNGNGKLYEQTFYSRVKFKSGKRNLSVTFRSGLLVFEIGEIDATGYRSNPLISIYISPIKAMMLTKEIAQFKEYMAAGKVKDNVAFGVNAGMGEKISYIGLHANKDMDVILTIGKFDGTGKIIESYDYTFQKDFNYSLEWKDITKNDLEKVYHNEIEYESFFQIVADFARYMNGVAAYATADLYRYEEARILNKMDPIYDKLGIERRTNNNFGGTNNFLNNAQANTSSTSKSFDEINDLLN